MFQFSVPFIGSFIHFQSYLSVGGVRECMRKVGGKVKESIRSLIVVLLVVFFDFWE